MTRASIVPNDGETKARRPRLNAAVLACLRSLRGPGESWSDVILQLAAEGTDGWRDRADALKAKSSDR